MTHYRNASKWRDLIPRIDKKGIARSRETIVDLISHPNAGLHDHGFVSLAKTKILICKSLKSSGAGAPQLFKDLPFLAGFEAMFAPLA